VGHISVKAAAVALTAIGLVVPAAASGANAAAPRSPAPPFTVIASGLANPRGLAFGERNSLFVAEAGLGSGTAATGIEPGIGHTGLIQAISDPEARHPNPRHPQLSTVVGGLWSAASTAHGFETEGVAGISAPGGDRLYAVVDGFAADPQSGRLLKVDEGSIATIANVSAADLAWEAIQDPNLNRDFPDANPYGVLVTGHRMFVVDAASNTLDEVGRNGAVRVVAYFPNPEVADAVPTCLAQGPDGALYVGTLAIAAGPGGAKVFRVDPDTTESVFAAGSHVWASGLSAINGCAFSPDGQTFYASEYIAFELLGPPGARRAAADGPPPGAVIKIPFAQPSSHTPLGFPALTFPGGVAVSASGAVYVANFSNNPFPQPLLGQVVRLADR
jgi:hypothetical protein